MQIRSGLHPLSSATLCPRCLSCHVACPRCVTVLHAMTLLCHHRGVAYDHLASSRSGRSDKPMSDVISEGGRWWAAGGGCVSQHELSVRGRREAGGCTAVYMYTYRSGRKSKSDIITYPTSVSVYAIGPRVRGIRARRGGGLHGGLTRSGVRTRVKVARVGASACGRHDSTQNGQHIKTLSNVPESVCSCLRPLPAPLGAGPLALTTSPRGSKKRSS